MISFFRLFIVIGALFCATASAPAAAQSDDTNGAQEGIMNAMTFRPVPPGAAIVVQTRDNSDINLKLKARFETALRQHGFSVSADAPLVLSFETRNVVGAWSDSGRRSILELEGHGGRMGGETAKARVNLFNSSRGGLLNKGQGETNIVTQGRYRLDATLDDRAARKRLWQGWAESDLGRYHGAELLGAMVPVMAAKLGHTVKRQTFKLP